MKHLKKLGSVLLALVMVMALAAPAFAAGVAPEPGLEDEFGGNGTLTEPEDEIHATNVTAGDTVNYYQLVEWDSANRTWKLTATHGAAISAAGITLDDLLDGISEEEAGTIATALATATADGPMVPDSTGGTSYSATVTPGLYYLKAIPGADNTTTIYNPAFVSADYHQGNNTVDFNDTIGDSAVLKKSELIFDKTVDSLNPIEFVDVKPGDVIPYKITTKIPAYGPEFTSAEFKVSDTLTNLTLGDTITVTYGTTVVTEATDGSDNNVTITRNGNTFTVEFADTYLRSDRGEVDVTITYSGMVPTDALFNVNYMNNTATLTYSSKPNEDSATKTDATNHYTFSIDGTLAGSSTENLFEIYKTGLDANGDPIQGNPVLVGSENITNMLEDAEFTLTPYKDADGNEITNPVALTATSGEDGRIAFHGLEEGIYKLEETAAPNGYVKDGTTYYVKIDATYKADPDKNGSDATILDMLESYTIGFYTDEACTVQVGGAGYEFEITNDGPTSTKITDAGNKLNIENKQGTELPSTGGIGTTLFYVVGGVLVVGAVVLLITKRRTSVDDE